MTKKNHNQLRAGVVLSYLETGVNVLISLLYTPVMLRLLGQNEYGVYNTAVAVIDYLGLLSLGFGGSYMRFYSRYNAKNDGEGIKKLNGIFMLVYSTAAAISLVAGFVMASAPSFVFGTKFTQDELLLTQKLLVIMTLGTALSFISSVFGMYVTAHEKFIFQRILSIVTKILNPALTLPLLLLGYGSVGLTLVSLILSLACFVVNVIYCGKLGMKFSMRSPDKALFKEISVFSFFILLTSIAGQINTTIDKFLLARFNGSADVAVYEIGSKFEGYSIMLSTTVSSVFIPRINNYVAENRSDRDLVELMTRVGRIQSYIMSLLLFGFILVGRYFIGIYAGDGYEQSYIIALYFMIATYIPRCQNVGLEIQKAKNKHVFRAVAYLLIAFCNVAISIPLIKKFGISGAALGSALAIVIGNVIAMNIYYKKGIGLDMAYYWKNLFRPVLSAVIAFVPCFVLTRLWVVDRISRFIIVGALFVALFAVSAWFVGFNSYEKALAGDTIGKFTSVLKKKKS